MMDFTFVWCSHKKWNKCTEFNHEISPFLFLCIEFTFEITNYPRLSYRVTFFWLTWAHVFHIIMNDTMLPWQQNNQQLPTSTDVSLAMFYILHALCSLQLTLIQINNLQKQIRPTGTQKFEVMTIEINYLKSLRLRLKFEQHQINNERYRVLSLSCGQNKSYDKSVKTQYFSKNKN